MQAGENPVGTSFELSIKAVKRLHKFVCSNFAISLCYYKKDNKKTNVVFNTTHSHFLE